MDDYGPDLEMAMDYAWVIFNVTFALSPIITGGAETASTIEVLVLRVWKYVCGAEIRGSIQCDSYLHLDQRHLLDSHCSLREQLFPFAFFFLHRLPTFFAL